VLEQVVLHAGLAAGSFAAATLLPFSSEAMLLAALASGHASPASLVVAATAGNVAGALFNWWLGRNLLYVQSRRWFPFTPETIETASQRFAAYGHWSLLLSWVPVIGDPLTLIAGLLRVPVRRFLVLVATGKAARYVALAAITS